MRWISFAFYIFLTFSFLTAGSAAKACGWWGDGEVSRDIFLPPQLSPSGDKLEQTLSLQSAKLPGEMGYGIALPTPGEAIPYLLTTNGRPVNRIGELKSYGYQTVIDLGTSEKTAHHHRSETEAIGMTYYNIPIDGDMPNPEQVQTFRDMVVSSGNAPTLVYAPRAPLLGAMWTAYRLSFGTPMSYALEEGRALGLIESQEKELNEIAQ